MSTTASRADDLIQAVETEAFQRQARLGTTDLAAALWQVDHLEALVRRLCASVDVQAESIANQAAEIKRQARVIESMNSTVRQQRNQIGEQTRKLNDLAFRLCDDDGEDLGPERRLDAVTFARSTGAAAALRGEPS